MGSSTHSGGRHPLAGANKKMTVGQLQDALTGWHNAHKSDEQIASELRQIELTEELTRAAMNSMASLIDGPLSTEQIYVLEARSSMLAPPDDDLPKDAHPDTSAQRSMLAKAQEYTAKTYPQLPRFTATRLVARFQDGVETIQTYGGNKVKIVSDRDDPLWDQVSYYVRLKNTHVDTVEIDNGVEKPSGNDTTPWGRNGLVNSMLPFLRLDLLTSEAVSEGNPRFLRWETINGHRSAVFAFAVDKKKSDYSLNYCCFPDTSSVGGALFGGRGGSTSTSFYDLSGGNFNSGPAARPSGGGNFAYVSDWNPFKAKSGYRAELFLDPDSGAVLRTIIQARFKASDFVHSEDIRVDYAPMSVGRNNFYIPVRSFTIAEVVPNGASFVSHYGIRHQFVTQDYKDFQTMDGTYQVVALPTQGESSAGVRAVRAKAESDSSSTRRGAEGADQARSDQVSPDQVSPDQAAAVTFPSLETVPRPAGSLAISASAKPIQRPSDEDIKALLAKAAQYANNYWGSLPNFTCQQITQRFTGSRADKWEPIDTITGQLNYFDHLEDWKFEEYEKDHRKSHDGGSSPGRGISGFGIFGGVIRGLFRPTSQAEISWFENDSLGDETVQVFKYHVAKENSNLFLRASSMEVVVVGYHGMVYLDSATGEVRRITQIADDVPKRYPIYETLVSTDYDYASIGGQKYLLPIGAQVVLRERNRRGRLELNQVRFRDFHRFRTTSRIITGFAALTRFSEGIHAGDLVTHPPALRRRRLCSGPSLNTRPSVLWMPLN
jgi:hypothetical protein